MLAAAGLLRLGFLAEFISAPVLAGFKAGMGLVIAASQLGKVLGVPVEGESFFAKGVVGAGAARRRQPGNGHPRRDHAGGADGPRGPRGGAGRPGERRPPQVRAARLRRRGRAAAGRRRDRADVVHRVDLGRPRLRQQDRPPVVANRELLALGAANLGAGLFQAYPAGGGTSQTAVNDDAGARTRFAGVVTAGVTVLALTVLAPLLADLAQAILGAIVLVAAIGLVDLAPLRRIRTIRRRDYWLGLVALLGVLAVGVLRGVLEAVLISLLVLLHELDHPRIVAGERAPGLLAVRPGGRLFFANVRRVCEQIAAIAAGQQPPPRVLLLDLGAVNDLDVTALDRRRTSPMTSTSGGRPCGWPRRASGRWRWSAAPPSCSAVPTWRPTPAGSVCGSSRAWTTPSRPTRTRWSRTVEPSTCQPDSRNHPVGVRSAHPGRSHGGLADAGAGEGGARGKRCPA
jgi:SulP family sulfate permease